MSISFGTVINSNGGCGWQQPTGGLTTQVVWLGMGVGSHLALCLHLSSEPVNSRNGFEP